jgi:hypothetical protein
MSDIKTIIDRTKNKIINKDEYTFMPDHNTSIKLTDQVLLYNIGQKWKIIPLIIALSYPIIYDSYETTDGIFHVTIVICPITLRAVILKGVFQFVTYENFTMMLNEYEKDNLISVDSGFKIGKDYVVQHNKRFGIMICTLRNALVFTPDINYMIINSNKPIDTVVNMEYYSNNFNIDGDIVETSIHPKTLCYLIQIKKKREKVKQYLLLGIDSSKDDITGYDIKKSGIYDYLNNHNDKIIEKEAYILPMLWYMAKMLYPNAKLLNSQNNTSHK